MKTLLLILFPLLLTAQSQNPFYYYAGFGISWVAVTIASDILPDHPGLSTAIGLSAGLISAYALNKYSWGEATYYQHGLVLYGAFSGGLTARCYIDWRGNRLFIAKRTSMRYTIKVEDMCGK